MNSQIVKVVLSLVLLLGFAQAEEDLQCFVPGECVRGYFIDNKVAPDEVIPNFGKYFNLVLLFA